MIQATFASETGFEKYGRKSKRELFLDTMNGLAPLARPGIIGRDQC
jgi:hypothetical protein